MSRFSDFSKASAQALARPFQGTGAGTSLAGIMTRRDQMLALLLTPFFFVAAVAVAKVVHEVILEFLPNPVASLSIIVFMSGTVLVVATLAAVFFWVRTGGFGIFAE